MPIALLPDLQLASLSPVAAPLASPPHGGLQQQQKEKGGGGGGKGKKKQLLKGGVHGSPSLSSSAVPQPVRYVYFRPLRRVDADANENVVDDDSDVDADDEEVASRSLYAVNLPFDYDEANVSSVFAAFGDVECVVFSEKSAQLGAPLRQTVPQSARVVYSDKGGVATAMGADVVSGAQPFEQGNRACGMQRWRAALDAQRPDPSKLKDQVDRFMVAFDERDAAERAAFKNGGEADADGWTTVRYGKWKAKATVLTDAPRELTTAERKRKRKETDRVAFYSFERNLKKQKTITELQRKFKEDQAKIAALRQGRRFDPFALQ
jgi:hypothetical protein